MDFDVIVIGSGLGGLTAATSLARQGLSVCVLEQHYLPGGWSQSFSLDGFSFSPGIHYIGDGFKSYTEGLGISEDLVALELNGDGYDHVRAGDLSFDIPKGRERFMDRLCDRFPDDREAVRDIFDGMAAIIREQHSGIAVKPGQIVEALAGKKNLLRWGLGSWSRFLDRFTKNPGIRAVLSATCGNHGLSPAAVPTILHCGILDHYFESGVVTMGGAKAIPRAFIRLLRKHKGQILMRTRVARILVERNGQGGQSAIGVRLEDGRELRSRYVVSNCSADITYSQLLDSQTLSKTLRARLMVQRTSLSAVSLFLATDLDLDGMGLDSGNYWYSATTDVGAAFEVAKRTDLSDLTAFPQGFVAMTTLKDRSLRRDGLHTLESFAFVSAQTVEQWRGTSPENRPASYGRYKEHLTQCMLKMLENVVPDISNHVVFSSLATPLTNEHFVSATDGCMYGPEKTLLSIGPAGLPIKTEIEGLFHCGSSTKNGHGVIGVMQSGMYVAQHLLGISRAEVMNAKGPPLRIEPCGSQVVRHARATERVAAD